MKVTTEPYLEQVKRWPASGRHILAQFDTDTVVVYQAYRPAIGRFAAEHGYFGGEFSLSRMSWIKPNFLWMMYRSAWATAPGQEAVLGLRISRAFFDEVLRDQPGDTDALFQIGRLAAQSGQQLDRGLAALRELAAHPDRKTDARLHTFIGNILEKFGDKPGAITAYEAALASDPGFTRALEALRKLREG